MTEKTEVPNTQDETEVEVLTAQQLMEAVLSESPADLLSSFDALMKDKLADMIAEYKAAIASGEVMEESEEEPTEIEASIEDEEPTE